MATNGTAIDGTAQAPEISIDLLHGLNEDDPPTATVSIPSESGQTVRATVEPTERGRWRCDFHVDRCSTAVSRTPGEDQVDIGELADWVTPVLRVIEALVTEAGC